MLPFAVGSTSNNKLLPTSYVHKDFIFFDSKDSIWSVSFALYNCTDSSNTDCIKSVYITI